MTTDEELLKAHGWEVCISDARNNTGWYWDRGGEDLPCYKGYPIILFVGHDGRVSITCKSYDDEQQLGLKPDADIRTFDNVTAALMYFRLGGMQFA